MKHQEKRLTNSAGCIVFRGMGESLEILLIKPFVGRDVWGVPKGHQDLGESMEETAVRETHEESGVEVVIAGYVGNTVTINNDECKTVHVYLARPAGDDTPNTTSDPDGETADARWFNVNSLPNIHAYQRDLVMEGIVRLHKIIADEKISA